MQSVAEIMVQIIRDEGVTHVFGNPGSTELAFMEALDGSGIDYVLALQEVTAVAMADGYAQASGRTAFVNLHTLAGLGHAIGAISGARLTRAPMVVTAGNQDTRHMAREPWLAGDLAGVAGPVTKWAREAGRASDVPLLLRRAFRDAAAPPRGPVFLSVPMDIAEERTDEGSGRRSNVAFGGVPANAEALAERLSTLPPGRLALLLGDEVWQTPRAAEATRRLAEVLEAAVFGGPLCSGCVFPTDHPAWRGELPPETDRVRARLENFDLVLGVGGRLLHAYAWRNGPFVPDHVTFAHLSAEAGAPGRTEPVSFGIVGDIADTLVFLADRVAGARTIAAVQPLKREGCLLLRDGAGPAGDEATIAVQSILAALPANTPVVNEACCTFAPIRDRMAMTPGNYFFTGAGYLGWGMPAAVGVSLARDRSPVVCLVGDGAAMYAPQALWSARREGAPVVFVVVDNGEYGLLKAQARQQGLPKAAGGHFLAMDFEPRFDFCALATSMGLPSTACAPAEAGDAVRAALASQTATVVHVRLK